MARCGKTAVCAAVALGISGGAAHAAVNIDGVIGSGEWDNTPTLSPLATASGVEVKVQSDPTNLYILGDVGDANVDDGFDVFDVNIGLQGNAAAWRYRLISKNSGPFKDNGGDATQISGDWYGMFQGGDDTTVFNSTFGVPGNLQNLGLADLQWVVNDTNAKRIHEIAIPWERLLDDSNNWSRSPNVPLAFAGTSVVDDDQGPLSTAFPDGLDSFGNQSTYAKVEVSAVPLPAAAWLFIAGLGAVGAVARRRAQRA